MPRLPTVLSAAVLSAALLMSGCTSTSYDLVDTGSVRQMKFKDTDPQDFGANHPGRHEVHGIDLSKWNGTDIDWQTVKKSGVAFVFIKGTEGKDRIDSAFATHWRNAANAGIPHAAYHFYYFCSTPEDQADWFIANVPKEANMLPPVLDMEWNHRSPTCSKRPDGSRVRAEARRFLDILERHYGRRPIVYTTPDFYRDTGIGKLAGTQFWLRSVAGHPAQTYPGARWTFWQYTGTGVVPGIDGPVDINVFAGPPENWAAWPG